MTKALKFTLTAALVCASLAACSPGEKPSTDVPATPAAHDHSATAKHGGAIAELEGHAGLVEVVFDGDAGRVTVYVMDIDGAPLAPDDAPVLNLAGDGAPVQVTGMEKDGAWVLEHESLKGHGHVHGARLRISVGSTQYNPDLPDVH